MRIIGIETEHGALVRNEEEKEQVSGRVYDNICTRAGGRLYLDNTHTDGSFRAGGPYEIKKFIGHVETATPECRGA